MFFFLCTGCFDYAGSSTNCRPDRHAASRAEAEYPDLKGTNTEIYWSSLKVSRLTVPESDKLLVHLGYVLFKLNQQESLDLKTTWGLYPSWLDPSLFSNSVPVMVSEVIGIYSVVELIVISFNLFFLKLATVTYDQIMINQINQNQIKINQSQIKINQIKSKYD